MRSKKAKVEDGEEGGEDEAEGEQFMAVDHEDDAGYVFCCIKHVHHVSYCCI